MLGITDLSGFGGILSTGASHVYATWNLADKTSGITLSNGNKTAAYSTYNENVRATVGKQTGKWYWEITVSAINLSAYLNAGVWPGSRAIGTYIYSTTGVVRIPGGGGTIAAGSVLGFRYDADAGTCALYINNVLYGTASFTVSEPWYPVIGDDNGGAAATLVANFGASAFTYSVPAGYNAGLY